MITNPIGKKVNLLEKVGICDWKMNDEVCEIVNVIPWSQELKDWCQHYVVRKPDGSEVEVRECDCVFSPDAEKDETNRIYQFLSDNGVDGEVSSADHKVYVYISWGDWKHDHAWCQELMSYLGYKRVSFDVTDEDGSDCFSAEHTYIKAV